MSADLCAWSGFRGLLLLDILGSHQLLASSHVRERDKALLRSVMVGGVWNGFWERCVVRWSLAGSVVVLMEMVISFGNVLTLLLLRFENILSFTSS